MGPYDSAKENLQGFGQALRKVINPNFERQEFVRNKILEDPTYAQQLADQEHESPGFLKGAGLDDNLINVIVKRPQSTKSIVEAKKRGITSASIDTILNNPDAKDEIAEEALGVDIIGRQQKKANVDNTRAGTEATKAGTVRTNVLTEGDRFDNLSKEIKAQNDKDAQALMPLILKGNSAELNEKIFQLQQQEGARGLIDRYKETMRKGLIQARREIDPNDFNTMLANPQFSQLYEADWKSDLAAKEATWQRQLASVRITASTKDYFQQQLDKRMADNADALIDRGVNPDIANAFVHLDGNTRQSLESMTTAPTDPQQKMLWDAARINSLVTKERVFAAKNAGIFGKLKERLARINLQASRATDPISKEEQIANLQLEADLSLGEGALKFGEIKDGSGFFGRGTKVGIVGGSEMMLAPELGVDTEDDPIAKEAWDEINSGKGMTFDQFMALPEEQLSSAMKAKIKRYQFKYEKKQTKKPESPR